MLLFTQPQNSEADPGVSHSRVLSPKDFWSQNPEFASRNFKLGKGSGKVKSRHLKSEPTNFVVRDRTCNCALVRWKVDRASFNQDIYTS